MLKTLAVFAVVLAYTLLVSGQPNKAGSAEYQPSNNPPSHAATIDREENQHRAKCASCDPDDKPFEWHTAVKRADWWLVIVGFITFGIVTAQAILMRQHAKHFRELAKATRKSAGATQKSAEAARQNVAVFIASQRPQIVVIAHEDPTQDLASETPRVQMELTNRGPTTALGLFYEWWIEIMPFPFIDFTENADYYKSPELISVYPGQPPMVLNIPLSRGLTAAQLNELKRAEKFACIRLKATYRDGFSKKLQWVSFGYYIQADGLGFLDKYNDSGEEQKQN